MYVSGMMKENILEISTRYMFDRIKLGALEPVGVILKPDLVDLVILEFFNVLRLQGLKFKFFQQTK